MTIAFVIVALLAFSWFFMQWTHEAGHMLAGVMTGARIERVVLDPRTFSRTDFAHNPFPLITCWGGPLLGILLGAGACLLLAARARSWRFTLFSIAAFILLANGLYIGLGAFTPVGDAQTMIRLGTPRWVMILFGFAGLLAARALLLAIFKLPVDWPRPRIAVFLGIASIGWATVGLLIFPA